MHRRNMRVVNLLYRLRNGLLAADLRQVLQPKVAARIVRANFPGGEYDAAVQGIRAVVRPKTVRVIPNDQARYVVVGSCSARRTDAGDRGEAAQ